MTTLVLLAAPAAPPFAAFGYDHAVGTWESPRPHPAITAGNWVWSDRDPVKRWDRTAFFVDQTLDFLTKANLNPVLEATDRQVGRLLDGLRDLGIDGDTWVLFLSDNGPLPASAATAPAGVGAARPQANERP